MTTLALFNPTSMVASWGYVAIFVLSLLQSCCVPTSSELVLGFGGVLAAQGTLKLPAVILAGAAGEVVGAYIAWGAGRAGARPLVGRYGRYVLLSPADLDRAEGWYGRHERWGVLASRLLPLIRNFAAVPAGAARVPPVRFGILTAIGSLIWASAMALIGYAIGNRWQTIMKGFSAAGYLLGALAVIALAVVVWHRWRSYHAATRGAGHEALPRSRPARRTFADDAGPARRGPASPLARPGTSRPDQPVSTEPSGVFPFSDYDSLPEPMILSALSYLMPKQLIQVREYESGHLQRRAILARIDRLLASRTATLTVRSRPANGATPAPREIPATPAAPSPAASAPRPASMGGLVDAAFGKGTLRRLSQASLDDVVDCLRSNRVIDAAFSAGHYLALGNEPEWSPEDHQQMVQARRASIERARREGNVRAAASGCAALRLLTPDLPDHVEAYASVVREDLRRKLAQQEIDLRAAGAAADLFLISGEWLPDADESSGLIRAVRSDIAARLQVSGDPLLEVARVALWLVASRGAQSRATASPSRGATATGRRRSSEDGASGRKAPSAKRGASAQVGGVDPGGRLRRPGPRPTP